MVAAEDVGNGGVAERLGLEPDMVVQEIGWDVDVDDDLRASIEQRTGAELLDEEADEVIDVMLVWWRDGDGDLVDDALLGATTPLAEDGVIWLLTPKTGRDGHVEPSDIAEASATAGLSQTSNISVGSDWSGTRLVLPKAGKGRR